MTPASSSRWTRSATAGVERPILPADLRKGLSGILLQGFQDLPRNSIKFEVIGDGPVRHVPAILKQQALLCLILLSSDQPFPSIQSPFSDFGDRPMLCMAGACGRGPLARSACQEGGYERIPPFCFWAGHDSTRRTPSAGADFLPLKGTDHVEFYVGNARQAAYFYRAAFGMSSGRLRRTGNRSARSRLVRGAAGQDSLRAHHAAAQPAPHCPTHSPARRRRCA
jgi:hypothetical protein